MHEKKAKKALRKYFYAVKVLQNNLNFDQNVA